MNNRQTPLKADLLQTLARSGPITFERYMALCLYHPEHGYYMQRAERTGVGGDYFTSSDLHPVFARLLARQAVEMWEILGRPRHFTWVEMGAGRGLFARDFLEWVKLRWPEFDRVLEYVVVEPGPPVQARLGVKFAEAGLQDRIQIAATLEDLPPVTGCFFSNELADAFPVAVVTRFQGRLKEVYVHAEGGALVERFGPISSSEVAGAVARYAHELEEGSRVEVSLAAMQWFRSVAEKLARGFVITIDYGDLAERLYLPERSAGTLMAYHRHVASADLYTAPGEQDLTAHVNFSALIDAGKGKGLERTGFTTQERFLMGLGEADEFRDLYGPDESEASRLQARLQLKRLLYPEGMGSLFKVLIQHRGVAAPQLTGLKFQR
ncbi:MAG: SAM-dependent methyltransferase [Acidobacteria bacterium]|nr:SAM-dependent methyltransferase [Acidobacteriota bacterium]